jgi:anti-sigma B factor antagonist
MAPISVTLARRKPPAAVVALVGEHDAYSSERLANELAVLLDSGHHIVVDLRDTSFLDSTSLGVLLNARHDAEHKGLRFALVLVVDEFTQVQQLLSMTGLGAGFASFGKIDDALNAVSPSRSVEAA